MKFFSRPIARGLFAGLAALVVIALPNTGRASGGASSSSGCGFHVQGSEGTDPFALLGLSLVFVLAARRRR